MSQSSNTSPHSSITSSCPPKKFLKKGEGLKRFAAYKPPPPMTATKLGRRQTFVKFKLHDRNQSSFIPPELLNDESINLSTEIPKIAPPKIMHTPIRPNRQALGALRPTTLNFYDYDSDEHMFDRTPQEYPRGHENGTTIDCPRSLDAKVPKAIIEKNLSRKVATITPKDPNKMISFHGFRKPATPSPLPAPQPVAQPVRTEVRASPGTKPNEPSRRYNLRGSRKALAGDDEVGKDVQKRETRRTKRQIKAIVERHISPPPKKISHEQESSEEAPKFSESQIKKNIDNLLQKIERKKESLEEASEPISAHPIIGTTMRVSDLSTPSPGNCILALGLQIQQIESTVNELQERMKNCECGCMFSPSEAPSKRFTRKTTRSKANDKTRPSANADNTTPKLLTCLLDEMTQLRARVDEMTLTGHKAL